MTRSMSAASPTSSVIAVEGVSGEMATPAFILRSWMMLMREMGSAAGSCVRGYEQLFGYGVHTCCLEVEAVEGSTRVGDVANPLRALRE